MQFEKQGITCLQTLKWEYQNQEQTQELRISDGMPDVGTIIGAWGQVILRGKEWHGDSISVNGGTMVWVQYLPEEGGPPQWVESWIPFQMQWTIPETQYDGIIMAQCLLRSVDARSLSARKLMLRTNVSVLGTAMEKKEHTLYVPRDIPEDVQLRTQRYPMLLPVEAGEKAFAVEETLTLPPSVPRIDKLIFYTLQPHITEERLMGDKVVFRGNAVLHILYCGEDGGQYAWDFDLPFTQYSELEGDFGDDAEISLWPCVTALEIDREEDQLILKAGLVCQYRICHRQMIEVVEDAYSLRRSVAPSLETLELPGILENKTQPIHVQQTSPLDAMRLTDVQFSPHPPKTEKSGEEITLTLPGQFQMLCYDMDGNLRTANQKWEQKMTVPAGENTSVEVQLWPTEKCQGNLLSGNAQMSTELMMTMETRSSAGIPMITGLELGEIQQPDPRRPSLILKRMGGKSLWELAKQNGSTVTAIEQANNLQTEPEAEQMLLIPVI